MESGINVAVNDKGHAVITYSLPLSDFCMQRARTLSAMVQVVSGAKSGEDGAALVKPLMELIRAHVDEIEPLFRALDQRAYEKGFEDGRDVSNPKPKHTFEFTKAPLAETAVIRPAR